MKAPAPDAAPPAPQAPYTLRQIEEMLGLPRSAVAGLVAAGFVVPTRGPRNEYRFSFQDVVLLRTAHHLRAAQVPPRKLLRSLKELRAKLPAAVPLSGLRIQAIGNEVAVRDGNAPWAAESGQWLMDFEVAAERGAVAFIEHGGGKAALRREVPPAASAEELFREAERLEADDPAAAEQAYREVLEQAADHAAAAINLSALLCAGSRSAEAVEVCRHALKAHADAPLLHFNLAIALEDLQHPVEALEQYGHCLRLDSTLADAHFNAARLHEQLGRQQEALRHYSAYRRLSRTGL